jgi:hypothetical protein
MIKPNKLSRDTNERAHEVGRLLTGEPPSAKKRKNPSAVALGRLGGLKGGRARADKLTAAQRRESARKAARSRWKDKSKENLGLQSV